MKDACPRCGHIHASDDTRAVSRFGSGGITGYVAAEVPGAPVRPTRAEAEADKCAHRVNA